MMPQNSSLQEIYPRCAVTVLSTLDEVYKITLIICFVLPSYRFASIPFYALAERRALGGWQRGMARESLDGAEAQIHAREESSLVFV